MVVLASGNEFNCEHCYVCQIIEGFEYIEGVFCGRIKIKEVS